MWELTVAVGLVCLTALGGLRMWLGWMHPLPKSEGTLGPQEASSIAVINHQIAQLKEDIQDIRLGKAFRGQSREEE